MSKQRNLCVPGTAKPWGHILFTAWCGYPCKTHQETELFKSTNSCPKAVIFFFGGGGVRDSLILSSIPRTVIAEFGTVSGCELGDWGFKSRPIQYHTQWTPRNISQGESRRNVKFSKSWSSVLWRRVVMWCSVCLHFHPEDRGSKVLRNVGILPHHYKPLQHRTAQMLHKIYHFPSCVLEYMELYLQFPYTPSQVVCNPRGKWTFLIYSF
jgi:hypothetical protein